MATAFVAWSLLLGLGVHATPAPTPAPAPMPAPAPQVLSSLSSDFSSITGAAASALPTILGGWPSLGDIEKKLGVKDGSDSSLDNISVSGLLIPSYANFSGNNWNIRFYGLGYKQPNVSTSDLDSLIDGLSSNNLNSTQQALLQNRTQALAAVPIPKVNFTGGVMANGSLVSPSTGIQLNTADDVGEIDQFVEVDGLDAPAGDVKVVELYLNASGPANGTSILVPPQGFSIVSDIDDVLRITKVYVPNEGLNNSFVNPYVNVPGFPELFAKWLKSLPGVAFHYDTTTPVELTRTYVEYLFSNYPLGSLEMRPINITDPSQILDARQDSLLKLFQTFPQRKFVLIGDTSSSTLLSAYPQIATQFPQQVACIFIRNTSATDPDDKIPYNTKPFQNLSSSQYFFYETANDLMNLDIANGQCVNSSIPQNVSFGEQGGILGGNSNSAATHIEVFGWAMTVVISMMFGMFVL